MILQVLLIAALRIQVGVFRLLPSHLHRYLSVSEYFSFCYLLGNEQREIISDSALRRLQCVTCYEAYSSRV